jgi:hyperosmotically inducible periplasmic protein
MEKSMKYSQVFSQIIFVGAIVIGGTIELTGCNHQPAHPDDKSAVTSSLRSNNLGDISVSQDQQKGVITLGGNVNSQDQKDEAERLAKAAAPGYTVANEVGVRPPGAESQAGAVASSVDNGIEDNFKAALKGHKNLDDQSIDYSAKNGTLVLKGSVKTTAQKKEAEALGKKVPNVQQVVNEIEVKSDKRSTPRS